MIQVRGVSKSFETADGVKAALRNVSFNVADGECTVISGENGSGKSLLMSIIAGLEEADSGSVTCTAPASGTPADTSSGSQRVGLVFQEAETQILGETPREDIAFGPVNLGWPRDRVSAAVQDALDRTGLTARADFPARFLSGGEKRRLAAACMLAMNLPVIILDEPFANLDYTGVKQVNALIRQLKEEGKTVVILTHELEKCLALADHFIVLFRGEKVFDGTPAQGLTQDLEQWNVRNPLTSCTQLSGCVW